MLSFANRKYKIERVYYVIISTCNNYMKIFNLVFVDVLCDKINVHNGFSPNNDGINDIFVIEGIENYENNTVKIFNRWGNSITTINGYDNKTKYWDGSWSESSEILPSGTYFYTIEIEGKVYTGYVQLLR